MTRRENGDGALYQKCEARFGCPPRDANGDRPKHKCEGRWFGEHDAGFKRDGSRNRRTVSAKTRAEANTKLKLRLRDLDRGDGADSKRTTVNAWATDWLAIAEKKNRPNTHTTDMAGVKWIVETIGHKSLDKLRPQDIRAVHAAIESQRSSSTAARYHGTMMRMLKAASMEGHRVPPNVFLVKTPEPDVNDRDAVPTPEALAILKAATTVPQASRWVAALLQGIRQGETLGLTWDEVNEDYFTLAWQLQPLPYKIARDRTSGFRVPRGYEARQLDGQMHLVRPKSKAGWRVVPMLPVMWQALEAWKEEAPKSPHGLVWPALDGAPADENEDRQEWYGIQGAAEVGHPAGRYYTVHEARHTTGTLLRLLGVSEEIRIAIMGWSSIASAKTYEHIDAAKMREMRQALLGVAGVLELSPADTPSTPE